MLVLALFIILTAVALPSVHATPVLLTRVTSLTLVSAAVLAANSYSWTGVGTGLSLYSGVLDVTGVALIAQVVLLVLGALALVPWAPYKTGGTTAVPRVATYPLFALISTIGGCLLVASGDMITVYLALELQSFAVYVLAALYRDSESATHSGLLYFLLGGLSSSLILLGFALVYSQTGLTSLEGLASLLAVGNDAASNQWAIILGFAAISTGLLFKVTAAPYHNWGPDVYDGVPTIVTTWLAVLPKISLLMLILTLTTNISGSLLVSLDGGSYDVWTTILLVSTVLSLVVGTVVGLAQRRIKRLLAYSTVSHMGFLLLAASICTQESASAFIFYLIQYSLTALLSFSILLGLSYARARGAGTNAPASDIGLISELSASFSSQPVLSACLAVVLFSMAGVPPLLGFFGKQAVLYGAINTGYIFVAVVAVITSVISAGYYLSVIRTTHFDVSAIKGVNGPVYSDVALPGNYFTTRQAIGSSNDSATPATLKKIMVGAPVSWIHSYTISVMTLMIVMFNASPDLLLDGTRLLALTLYNS
jgi:NADH-ubiquinone oxidoreductase chain 2